MATWYQKQPATAFEREVWDKYFSSHNYADVMERRRLYSYGLRTDETRSGMRVYALFRKRVYEYRRVELERF